MNIKENEKMVNWILFILIIFVFVDFVIDRIEEIKYEKEMKKHEH